MIEVIAEAAARYAEADVFLQFMMRLLVAVVAGMGFILASLGSWMLVPVWDWVNDNAERTDFRDFPLWVALSRFLCPREYDKRAKDNRHYGWGTTSRADHIITVWMGVVMLLIVAWPLIGYIATLALLAHAVRFGLRTRRKVRAVVEVYNNHQHTPASGKVRKEDRA